MKDVVNVRTSVVFWRMKLKKWITREGLTQTDAAALIGMTGGHLSMLIAGKRRPSLSTLDRIDRVTEGKVTWKDWAGRG